MTEQYILVIKIHSGEIQLSGISGCERATPHKELRIVWLHKAKSFPWTLWLQQMKLRLMYCEGDCLCINIDHRTECIFGLLVTLSSAWNISIIFFQTNIWTKMLFAASSHECNHLMASPVQGSTYLVWTGLSVLSLRDQNHLGVFFWWSFPLSHQHGFLRVKSAAEQRTISRWWSIDRATV